MIPTRCSICSSSHIQLDVDRIVCLACGRSVTWEFWSDGQDDWDSAFSCPACSRSDKVRVEGQEEFWISTPDETIIRYYLYCCRCDAAFEDYFFYDDDVDS